MKFRMDRRRGSWGGLASIRVRLLAALAIGNQAAIDREGWDLFRTTGVAHLMSISGLHITMISGLFFGFASLDGHAQLLGPTKDIAERMGKTDGAVRVLLTRSLSKLQALMGTSEGS